MILNRTLKKQVRQKTKELRQELAERRAAEDTLRQSEEKYRLLVETSPDCICHISLDGRFLSMNAAGCRIHELRDTDEAVGQSCTAGIVENRAEAEEAIRHAVKGESTELRYKSISKNGREIWWDAVVTPIRDIDGVVTSILRISRDITEHRNLEAQFRQAQKMEAIGTLAGGIAHDFNNILSAIIGYGHVALMKMADDDPQRLNIGHILEAADRAAHLTKDLLLFSRKQISTLKPVDLNEIIRKVEKFLHRVIGEDVEFKTILQGRPITVFADSHQIEQVLMNFATNARDAMPDGGSFTIKTEQINIKEDFLSAHGYGKPGDYAMITVSDTGKGMDKETQPHIFEPFFTTKEVGQGTGLGLAVTYGIIKQHEGYINVYSEPDKGTTFRLYMPIIIMEAGKEPKSHYEEAPGRGTETVLLAEDNESVRNLTQTVLSEFGYTVIEAVDGEDAVRKFMENKETIQILLFDLIMPKKNGKEAYDEIRKIKPDTKVIFTSGYAPDLVWQKISLENGARLIFKPILPMELLRLVRRVLDGTK